MRESFSIECSQSRSGEAKGENNFLFQKIYKSSYSLVKFKVRVRKRLGGKYIFLVFLVLLILFPSSFLNLFSLFQIRAFVGSISSRFFVERPYKENIRGR